MAKGKIYFGQLERFGYTLTVVGRTEDEVYEALEKAYVEAYKNENYGADPREDVMYGDRTYYDVAMDEMYIDEFIPGEVQWL